MGRETETSVCHALLDARLEVIQDANFFPVDIIQSPVTGKQRGLKSEKGERKNGGSAEQMKKCWPPPEEIDATVVAVWGLQWTRHGKEGCGSQRSKLAIGRSARK